MTSLDEARPVAGPARGSRPRSAERPRAAAVPVRAPASRAIGGTAYLIYFPDQAVPGAKEIVGELTELAAELGGWRLVLLDRNGAVGEQLIRASGSAASTVVRAQNDPVVGQALRLMHEDPAHRWSVAELAERTAVSRSSLARRFTAEVGESPMAYLIDWRITLAADLLRETNDTVESIARRVGYADAFALSIAFKRVRGLSPTAHRHNTAASIDTSTERPPTATA